VPTPRQITWAKLRVSVVAITAVVIFLELAYLLTGGTLLARKANLYLYTNDATGLSTDSPVSVDGIDIGKVVDISLSGSSDPARTVKVTMKVEEERLKSVPDDSVAEISADSLVGDKYVDVASGKSATHLAPNGELKFRSQAELMSRIDLSQFQDQIAKIDAVLTDIEQGRSQLGQFIKGDAMYVGLLRTLGQLESAFHAAMASTAQVGGAMYTDEIYRALETPFVQLDKTLAEIDSGQGPAGRFLRDPADYESWVNSIEGIRKEVEAIGTGAFFQSDESYQSWNKLVASTITQVDQMSANPMLNNASQYEALAGSAAQLRDTLRDFHRDPAKYMRYKIF
jgi:phospholipid/cholesterol/gamma-HCH transport system substrate-binding protein